MVYQSIQELLLKALVGEDHGEELTNVKAVSEETGLQRYKLEPQAIASSRHDAVNGVLHLSILHC